MLLQCSQPEGKKQLMPGSVAHGFNAYFMIIGPEAVQDRFALLAQIIAQTFERA
jgi:hypothetical protein